jgi:hypothetical protein
MAGFRRGRFLQLAVGLIAVMLLALAPAIAQAGPSTRGFSSYAFPSSSSTVVASVGFIDGDEIGYFWSESRGDSVSESFSGPSAVDGAQLQITVVQNVLNSGAHVDWALDINGVTVTQFSVPEGFTGALTKLAQFAPIAGPNYNVVLRVTNEVAGGEGSITLAYAGSYVHCLKLHAAPGPGAN